MNHDEAAPSSLESDAKNYKSLYEEIAQNDSKVYLNNSLTDDIIRFDGESDECCCCKVHRRQNSFIAGGAVTKPFNIPIYNTIWVGEMRNATDYIEYLNETRRNSFSSLNKDIRSNYYKLLPPDNHSLNDYEVKRNYSRNSQTSNAITSQSGNFLQVPKQNEEYLRRPLTPAFEDISRKIDEITTLDSSVSTLIYKSIEVHADILVSERRQSSLFVTIPLWSLWLTFKLLYSFTLK